MNLQYEDPRTWRVLMVDDQLDCLIIVENVIKFNGGECMTEATGQDALNIIATYNPNLLLLDLQMPAMSGWEVLEQVRQMPLYADLPVIAITAHTMQGDKQKSLASGFTGHIAKPVRPKTLIVEIQKTLLVNQSLAANVTG